MGDTVFAPSSQPPTPVARPTYTSPFECPAAAPLVTQMYVKGAPENQWDWLLNAVGDDAARQRLIIDSEPTEDAGTASLRARFDIVLT